MTISERHRNAYPIGHGREWGEAAWTATDLVHRPGTLMAVVRNVHVNSARIARTMGISSRDLTRRP